MATSFNHFEDFHLGEIRHGGPVLIEAAEIQTFAARYDPQSFHLEEAAAAGSFFHGLVASGWHTASLTMRMTVEALGVAGNFIGLKVSGLRWPLPVRPGDQLRADIEITALRPLRSRPAYGLVELQVSTLNQLLQPVQHMHTATLIGRRP